MENNQFDNEIKKMLEGLEVPFQETHWERMSQRLQETQELNAPDTVTNFDKSISEKIASFEVPFSESNWMALRSRLVARAYLKKWIFQTKAIEGLFMLIFAMFLVGSAGTAESEPKEPVFQEPIAQVNPIPTATESASAVIKVAPEPSKVPQTEGRLATNRDMNNNSSLGGLYIESPISTNGILLALLPVKDKEVVPAVLVKQYDGAYATSEAATGELMLETPKYLSNPLVMLDIPSQLDLALPKIAAGRASRTNFGLSVYGIVNADHIITGIDPTTAINVPNVWSPGYGGGIAFSKRKGKLAISAGVEYQEVKYFPKPIVRITQGGADLGYAGSGTTTVELTKVSTPITIGYPLVSTRKHQLSVELGLVPALGKETFEQSTYIVGNSNEENMIVLRQKLADEGASASVYVNPIASRYNEPAKESSRVSREPKFFASARANIAYEFKLDRYHSIFAKASYTHQLTQNGIGLPKDHLNSVGLHFGSRVYL